MAPTVCLSELPIVRKLAIPCSRRRQRIHNGSISKQQRLEVRRIEVDASPRENLSLTPPESPLWEPERPTDSFPPIIVSSSSANVSARVPANMEEHWKVFLARRKGLLDIFVRTMALVRRNNILQERVNALREETRDFIHSVLNNPENKCRQQRLESSDSKDEDVSSSTEQDRSRSPSYPPTPDSTYSSSNDVSSTCSSIEQFSDDDDDES